MFLPDNKRRTKLVFAYLMNLIVASLLAFTSAAVAADSHAVITLDKEKSS